METGREGGRRDGRGWDGKEIEKREKREVNVSDTMRDRDGGRKGKNALHVPLSYCPHFKTTHFLHLTISSITRGTHYMSLLSSPLLFSFPLLFSLSLLYFTSLLFSSLPSSFSLYLRFHDKRDALHRCLIRDFSLRWGSRHEALRVCLVQHRRLHLTGEI